MKYAVISSSNKLICFDQSDQVAEYYLESMNHSLNDYCKDQEFNYETMSPTEIGQAYANVSAVSGACSIYETREILKVMKENDVEKDLIDEADALFNDRSVNEEINCPGYIEDILGEVTSISGAEMSNGVYTCSNVDDTTDTEDNG
ncbi:MAG: hypothetical protein RR618_02260 [Cellulosilyticaceae bacterium]